MNITESMQRLLDDNHNGDHPAALQIIETARTLSQSFEGGSALWKQPGMDLSIIMKEGVFGQAYLPIIPSLRAIESIGPTAIPYLPWISSSETQKSYRFLIVQTLDKQPFLSGIIDASILEDRTPDIRLAEGLAKRFVNDYFEQIALRRTGFSTDDPLWSTIRVNLISLLSAYWFSLLVEHEDSILRLEKVINTLIYLAPIGTIDEGKKLILLHGSLDARPWA